MPSFPRKFCNKDKRLSAVKTMWVIYFLCCSCIFTESWAFLKPKVNVYPIGNNPGPPSFVTPLIYKGKIKEAQQNCTVSPVKGNVKSYAGFFTVRNDSNSNMFFWFFPARSGPTSPVVLWLQGGPGATSLYGLFEENGPFYVKPGGGLKLRNYSWIDSVSILYIDNPVGTGFSFTEKDDGYAKNESDVAEDLLTAVVQFFKLFPELQKNDFFLSGESYAGKYVPALAYRIDKYNSMRKTVIKINLKGITIGNGFSDPEHMMSRGQFLYEIGLIDDSGLLEFQKYESEIVNLIKKKLYKQAFDKFDMLLNGDLTPYKSLFYNLTGFTNYFNYRFPNEISYHGDFSQYVQSDVGRRAIHVGSYKFHTDNKVEQFLINDVMQSVKPLIEALLEKKYRVLIYNGQLDIIVAYPLTVNFINSLNWSGKSKLANAPRNRFMVKNEIAGYYRAVDNFIELVVRDAGHMVPKDQPLWAFELITQFTYNKPL